MSAPPQPAPGTETHRCRSVEETLDLGAELAARLPGGSVVLLQGELGAGKTHFVKGLARGLGLDPDAVHSPTFTFVHLHEGAGGLGLVHVDLYRAGDASDLLELGLEELPGLERVAAVEWPERLGEGVPRGCWLVRLEALSETERLATIRPPARGEPPPERIL